MQQDGCESVSIEFSSRFTSLKETSPDEQPGIRVFMLIIDHL